MILKLFISASILTLQLGHVAATGCHELQLSQLKSLNDRVTQMLDKISSLLPKSIKKLTPPEPAPTSPPPPPVVDYAPTSAGPDMSYYTTLPAASPPPMQPVIYVPSYAALPTDIRLPRLSNPILTPSNYVQTAIAPQPGYPFTTISSCPPQSPQYVTQTPTPPITPPSYPTSPYSLIHSPYPPEYIQPYPFGYPLPAPTQPSIPANTPGLPFIPVPVQVQLPPGTYMLPYSQVSEIPQKYA